MEAAGLASSILTFIDVSYKVVKGAHEIYSSASGATSENTHVLNVISDLQDAAGNLGIRRPGSNDLQLENLSKQCQGLSEELLGLLAKLQAKDKKLLKSFAVALRGARKQKDVASIEKRLDQYRQQILLRLTVLICISHLSKISYERYAKKAIVYEMITHSSWKICIRSWPY
ncbi:hypothetical protein C8034_v004820 [Colletotrichum sidae]|uniref:Fungal N-terminal domain-containing protein n=1 Tax=Colletotrichum sidae TaxID=1347389 RepID=A0A4R8T7C9_9PEZI|nr:hypothetical protein C8034_v004820 [Colletotrichum sidae]